ncbi:unnamed protein product [Ectocarpus sp. 6 AP-2014]
MYHTMSLVARYKFNDPATFTADDTGNSYTLTAENGILSVDDAAYGTVANFSNSTAVHNYFLMSTAPPPAVTGNSSRTISTWVRIAGTTPGNVFIYGQGEKGSASTGEYFVTAQGASIKRQYGGGVTTPHPGLDTWFHFAITYDGSIEQIYIDGVSALTIHATSFNIQSNGFGIGLSSRYASSASSYSFEGQMLDFRIYDDSLSASDITDLHNEGPNPGNNEGPNPGNYLVPTARISGIVATVYEVPGALSYRVAIREDGSGSTRITHDGISYGDIMIGALSPGTSYTVTLFADTGSGYEEVGFETVQTLDNLSMNYSPSDYSSNGISDLSGLNESDFSLLSNVINDVFTTGEQLKINLGSRESKVSFVKRGETVSTDNSILVQFDSSSGSGQDFTMTLSDTSVVQVSYDETSSALNIGGQVVNPGESLIVDGKKLTVKEI